MKKQFDNADTFFDMSIDKKSEYFATLYCTLGGANKKRAKTNKLVIDYLTGKTLSDDDKAQAKKILDGTIYHERKKCFKHCRLCSDKFEFELLPEISSHYKNWELCFPTHPYTPAGMMIYLKDRKNSHIENLQDLSREQFDEIISIMYELYDKLSENLQYNVVGINILFNQISKSQLCIHGHLETMLANVNKLNLGCELKIEKNFDPLANILNEQIPNADGVYKEQEGIRIDLSKIDTMDALNILNKYETKMKQIIKHGDKLRNGELSCKSKIDELLLHRMSPAPVDYVYITYYRDKLFLSIVPEIVLEPVKKISEIKGEQDLYSLKINQYAQNDCERVMRQYSPSVRPSIKISTDYKTSANVKKLKEDIKNVLEER